MKTHILMVTGDAGIAQGKQNIFYEMLKEFSTYFEGVHVICGSAKDGHKVPFKIHKNVTVYPSPRSRFLRKDFWTHANFVLETALEINKKTPLSLVISHVVPPFFPGSRGGILVAEELKIPHLAEVMHIPGYPKADRFMDHIERRRMNAFLKKYHGEFSGIRIINEGELKPYLKNLGIPEKKLRMIPAFYLDLKVFKPRPEIKKNLKQFVYAGRFETNKNIPSLLTAFAKLCEETQGLKLKMIGDGTLAPWVDKERERLGLQEEIELLGWLPTHTDVAKIYNESLALIMPSFSEGGPRVTLEAMAAGTLVLSTPVGIMKEVMEPGENTLKIAWDAENIEKTMRYALQHPEEARRIAKNGQKSIQKFEYHKALGFYAETVLKFLS